MSLEAILDSIIHIDKFKTFDMLSQGTYRLKVKLYHIEDSVKIYSQPYLSPEKKYSYKKLQPEHQSIILDSENAFVTQMFYIKFCDQEFDINEMCVFRSKFPVWPANYPTFFAEIMLTYLNTENQNKKKNTKNDQDGFKTLSTITLKIPNMCKGVHEYVPVFFDNFMYSVAHTMIHSTLINYKFEHFKGLKELDKILKEPNLTDNQIMMVKIRSSKNFDEFVRLVTWKGDEQQINQFLGMYNRKLTNHIKDLIVYIEKIIEMYESRKKANDKRAESVNRICTHLKGIKFEF